MANIIPTEGASGNDPKILNTLANNATTGNMATIGSIRNSNDKPLAGLRFQSGQQAVSVEVLNNKGGQNGRRGSGGLNNTNLSNAVWGLHISGNAWNRISINTIVNSGIQVGLSSDTSYNNVRRWTIGGKDTVFGRLLGRNVIVVDSNNTGDFNSGSFDNTSVDRFSWTMNTQGSWSGTQSWFFCSHAFRVYKNVAGACGVYGSDASLKDFADACVTEAWILVETSKNNYNLHAPFKFGNGSNATVMSESNVSITIPTPAKDNGDDRLHYEDDSVPIFADPAVGSSPTFTNFTFNCGIPSVFDFDTNVGANWTWDGLTLNNCGQVDIGADHTLINSVITLNGSSRLRLQGGTIEDTIINGDVQMFEPIDLTNVTINGTLRISTGQDNSLNFSNVRLNNIINTNNGNFTTINATNGSSLPTTDGGTTTGKVNIIDSKSFTFEVKDESGNDLTNYEWRIYTVTALGSLAGSTEVAGEEVATLSSQSYLYNYTADEPAAIQIIHLDGDFEEKTTFITLGANNQTITINLKKDNNN